MYNLYMYVQKTVECVRIYLVKNGRALQMDRGRCLFYGAVLDTCIDWGAWGACIYYISLVSQITCTSR